MTHLRHRVAGAVVLGALVVCGAAGTTGCGSTGDTSSSTSDRNRSNLLEAVELQPLRGAPPLTLGMASQLPTVVNLWATWCAPCRKELPAFNAAAAAHPTTVRFVGVNNGEDADIASAFLDDIGSGFDHYGDPTAGLQAALSVTAMPATVFVRADGSVANIHRGALDADELDNLLRSELGVAK